MSRRVRRDKENTGFICAQCGQQVLPLQGGSYRNHCPHCLFSVHVDTEPGDRAADCGGLMRPVAISWPRGKDLAVQHICQSCGAVSTNRLATGDLRQPDSTQAIAAV